MDLRLNQQYDVDTLQKAVTEEFTIEFTFLDSLLDEKTAVLAAGHEAICIFVNDLCNANVVETLHRLGVVRHKIVQTY
jgi:D-lactate dehydrogenase